jgi:hypothetical protein
MFVKKNFEREVPEFSSQPLSYRVELLLLIDIEAEQMPKKDSQQEKLGEILQQSLKRLDLSARMEEYGVWPIWNEIVGPTIARNAQPEKIRHGTLFVKVTSPMWMQQLQYMKEMMTEKLNQTLGRGVVKNIFFLVGKVDTEVHRPKPKNPSTPGPTPIPESKLDEAHLSSVKDPEIRRALQRLYRAHSRKGRKER